MGGLCSRMKGVSSGGFARSAVAEAMVHGLFWLVVANGVGVLMAVLLLLPEGNALLGEWRYGRWVIGVKIIDKTGVIKTWRCLNPFLASRTLDSAVSGAEMNPFSVTAAE